MYNLSFVKSGLLEFSGLLEKYQLKSDLNKSGMHTVEITITRIVEYNVYS